MARKKVRLALIGVGSMGNFHLPNIARNNRIELAAVCDIVRERAEKAAAQYGGAVFTDYRELLKKHIADAVLIVTPHYFHTTIGIEALKQGYHVLVEKPISVHKADCERLIRAHTNKKLVFAAMLNQRTDPHYRKVKEILDTGKLGKLVRVNWIITDWFRTQAYYDSGTWRATWAGEGGGVLLNQCIHNIDLLQWLCGMPKKVHGFCSLGKWHRIEVEDEITAFFEYKNGATGIFISSTGEAPGTNRLEITGDLGRIIYENGVVSLDRNKESARTFLLKSPDAFARPAVENEKIPFDNNGGQHVEILDNFIAAILDRKKLVAPAREGINCVEFANAILMSSLLGKPVDIPLDGAVYERRLKGLIKNSKTVKKTAKTLNGNLLNMLKSR